MCCRSGFTSTLLPSTRSASGTVRSRTPCVQRATTTRSRDLATVQRIWLTNVSFLNISTPLLTHMGCHRPISVVAYQRSIDLIDDYRPIDFLNHSVTRKRSKLVNGFILGIVLSNSNSLFEYTRFVCRISLLSE